ncbi:hypothetical protein VNO78_08445 [Psophocarpus tetragonolobus]|uniref:Uncharacterized protein n=1 Tax=Psophocarpus tetragonolobus TaxID=3891 RepID=A0AAN9T5R8_PSOTE
MLFKFNDRIKKELIAELKFSSTILRKGKEFIHLFRLGEQQQQILVLVVLLFLFHVSKRQKTIQLRPVIFVSLNRSSLFLLKAGAHLSFFFYFNSLLADSTVVCAFVILQDMQFGMATDENADMSDVKSQLSQSHETWKQEIARNQSEVDVLQKELTEVMACNQGSDENAKKELEVLWRRVKTTSTMLTYLKSKARLMAVPHLAHTSCGIKQLEGVGFVDKNGIPLSGWCSNVDLSSFDDTDEESWMRISHQHGCLDEQDAAYIGEILNSVQMVADVMEALVKRVLLAESETAIEKEIVSISQEEIKRKSTQLENMSMKLEEMEHFALNTNSILNEMRQRVEDLVEETTRQRERAAENEEELSRVKREFESLKSYVSGLITVRETLLSSEKQFQTIERLFEKLVAKTTQLEGEKMQKEAEVQKLMEENVRLSAQLDKKEAQLLALNEQFKVMALNASNM